MNRIIEELLQSQYWIIDILPEQVSKDGEGQYFAVEEYFLEKGRLADIKQKHINVVLKLNCYRDILLGEEALKNPSPNQIDSEMRKRSLCIMVDGAMIASEPDDTHLTVYNPDEKLLELVRVIATGEGLYVWKPSL